VNSTNPIVQAISGGRGPRRAASRLPRIAVQASEISAEAAAATVSALTAR
jgi:hypothetical protein